MRQNERLTLFILIAAFLLIRLCLFIDLHASLPALTLYQSQEDMYVYQQWGEAIAHGNLLDNPWNGKPLSLFYALLCGALFWLFTASPYVVIAFQMLLGAASLALLSKVLRHYVAPNIAWVGLLLFMLYQPLAYYELFMLRDALLAFLILAAWYCWVRVEQGERFHHYFLGGVLALCFACRENCILLLPFFALLLLLDKEFRRDRWKRLGMLAVGFTVMAAPLIVIQAIWNAPPADYKFFKVVLWGNMHKARGYGAAYPANLDAVLAQIGNSWFKLVDFILGDMVRHPLDWLRLYGNKLWAFIGDKELPNNENLYVVLPYMRSLAALPIGWGMIASLGCVGGWIAWRGNRKEQRLVLFTLLNIGLLLLFFILGRYRTQTLPPFIILATIGISYGWTAARGNNLRGAATALLAVGVLAALAFSSPGEKLRAADYATMGIKHLKFGDFDRAETLFANAETLKPAPYYRDLRKVAAQKKRLTDSLHDLAIKKAASMTATEEARALFDIGTLHLEIGEIDAAESSFQASLKLLPRAETNYRLALIAWHRRDARTSRRYVAAALALDKNYAPAREAQRTGQVPSLKIISVNY